jgi:hypothetical protein
VVNLQHGAHGTVFRDAGSSFSVIQAKNLHVHVIVSSGLATAKREPWLHLGLHWMVTAATGKSLVTSVSHDCERLAD